MKVSLTKSIDNILNTLKKMKNLKNIDVLVGVPGETVSRKNNKEDINNAQLLYIHSKGSPLKNIPARPVIEPAISEAKNKAQIAENLKLASQLMLEGEHEGAIRQLHLTGLDAVNKIKAWFEDSANNWSPLQRATILARIRKQKSKKKRKELYDLLISDPSKFLPLQDTGQLRNAITYVVEAKEK